jgi:hypothetical protein
VILGNNTYIKRTKTAVITALFIATMLTPVTVGAEQTDAVYGYAKTFGGTGSDYAQATAVDSNDNVYLAGYFSGTADFDPGVGVDSKVSAGSSDIFLTKINADGSYGYTKTMGGTSSDQAVSVAVDSNNNAYVTGQFFDTVDFDPGVGVDSHTTTDSQQGFVTRINADGSYGYTKTMGVMDEDLSGYDTIASSIFIDLSDNIYYTGYFGDTVDFDPGVGVDNHTTAHSRDIFLTKLNADGSYGYTKTFGRTSFGDRHAVTTDNSNNVYVAGVFNGTADFDPGVGVDNHTPAGEDDIFLTKINANGSYGYTKTMGGNGFEYTYSLTADQFNNVFLAGYFDSTADFDPGVGVDNHTSAGSSDTFLTKINADGSYGYTKTIGSTAGEYARGVKADPQGDVYIAGYFSGTVDFDPGIGTDSQTSAGQNDIFLIRINADGSYGYTKTTGGTLNEFTYGLDISMAGDLYLSGRFSGTSDFDPGPGVENQTSTGGIDAYLIKLTQLTYQQITGLDPALSATTLSDDDATDNTVENGDTTTIRLLQNTTPIADITTTFATDLDWSGVTADSDTATGKAFVHNLTAADGTAGTYTLYIPKLAGADDRVGICPGASSLAAVTDQCVSLYYLIEGEDDNLTTVTIDNQDYWAVSGLTGTGGFSAAALDEGTDSDTGVLAETGSSTHFTLLMATLLLIIGLYKFRKTYV